MTIGFYPSASTPLPESLVASIILGRLVGHTLHELVELGYGKLTVDDIGKLEWLSGRRVSLWTGDLP